MPNPVPYMPFWVADWLASQDVAGMSLAAQGAYLRLLAFQWQDGSLANDKRTLERLLGVRSSDFEEIWQEVSPMFPENAAGRLENERCASEREKAFLKVQKNREAGSKGGEKKQANAKANAQANAIPDAIPNAVANAVATGLPYQSQSQKEDTHSAREDAPPEEDAGVPGPDPHQVTKAVEDWHRYLREKWEEFPETADVKYDAQTLRRFCREHPGTKPGDHVAYSIQRKAKTLQPKFPKLPPPAAAVRNGRAQEHPVEGADFRVECEELPREPGEIIATIRRTEIDLKTGGRFDRLAWYRSRGLTPPAAVVREAETRASELV